jgi:RsiW-degrading membrane proteinase PrsW (M82 family)
MMFSVLRLQEKVVLALNIGFACALAILYLVWALTERVLFVLIILFAIVFVVAYSAEHEKPKDFDEGRIDMRIGGLMLAWNVIFFIMFFIEAIVLDDPEFITIQVLLVGGGMLGAAAFEELGKILGRIRE